MFPAASLYPICVLETLIPSDAVAKRSNFSPGGSDGIGKKNQMATQRHNIQGLVSTMPARTSAVRNDYRCSIERNQAGKYCVRIRVRYPRHAWLLGVFYLASSFDKAMKKLEEAVDFLQRHEDKLWFWGVDRAEDMGFSA